MATSTRTGCTNVPCIRRPSAQTCTDHQVHPEVHVGQMNGCCQDSIRSRCSQKTCHSCQYLTWPNECTPAHTNAHWHTGANMDAHWRTGVRTNARWCTASLNWHQTAFIKKPVPLCDRWLFFGSLGHLFLCYLASADTCY